MSVKEQVLEAIQQNRRKVGWMVLGVSVLTAIVIQLFTGAVVQVRTLREDKLQSEPDFAYGMVHR